MSTTETDQLIGRRAPRVFGAILSAIFLGLAGDVSGQSTIDTLEPGTSVERDLKKGETHSYRIALDAGQYFQAVVNQDGIAVALKIYGRTSCDPPAALRAAQVSLLQGQDKRWAAPHYWAAFTIQGEWK